MSLGPDGLSAFYVKRISNTIALPLSILYQKSFNTGILPDIWKKAIVIPIYKRKGTKFDVNNYRSISLTCVLCKVMESITRNQTVVHCDSNKLISDAQHGFISNHSTVTNLLEIMNDITLALDNKDNIDLMCIDFSKAFDSVSHNKLLLKLKNYGINGNLLKWINSFLSNRRFSFKINNALSAEYPVTSSVPQGSILATIFFILFVNDLSTVVKTRLIKMYADDVIIYHKVNNKQDYNNYQKDLAAVQ